MHCDNTIIRSSLVVTFVILNPAWATVSLTTGIIWAGNCHSSSLWMISRFYCQEERYLPECRARLLVIWNPGWKENMVGWHLNQCVQVFSFWHLPWSVLALRSWADENTPSEISSVESVTFSCLLLPSCYNLAPASHKNFFAFLPSSVLLLYANTSERYWAIRGGCEPVGQEECFEI